MAMLDRSLLLASLFAIATACRGIAVDSTYDPEVDFAPLRTFDWLQPPSDAPTRVSDATMLGLIGAELEAKGLQRNTDKPDLLVAVQRTIEGSLNTKGSGYEWRDGRLQRYELQSGTLVVDLVAANTKQVAWRGTATGAFRFDGTAAERREMLTGVLHDMFASFPPRR